jgi:integrase
MGERVSIGISVESTDAAQSDPAERGRTRARAATRGRLSGPPRSRSALGRLMSDLNALYRQYRALRARGRAHVGEKTQRERRVVLDRAMCDLHRNGYELQRLANLRGTHIRAIIAEWRRRELKASTCSTNFSHLRTLCRWLNKPDLVRLIDDMVAQDPELTRRRTVADGDRSDRRIDLSREEMLGRARLLDARFGCVLRLIMAFGLRVQEALKFQPYCVVGVRGQVTIRKGTKGGRPRVLPFLLSLEQAQAIEEAQGFVQSAAETMIPRGWTVQRCRGWFYRRCEQIGLTRQGLGITPHAYRHGVLQEIYKTLTGEDAPVRGGRLRDRDPVADLAARSTVAQAAGHSRPHVSSHYLGPVRLPRLKGRNGRPAMAEAMTVCPQTPHLPDAGSPSVTQDSSSVLDLSPTPTDTHLK